MQQNFDDRLLKILEKEVLKEKWKKKVKIVGLVISKRMTKKGRIMLKVKTKRSQYDVVTSQYKETEFGLAKNIFEGDAVQAIGDMQISGLIFCDKISKSNIDKKQMKLLV